MIQRGKGTAGQEGRGSVGGWVEGFRCTHLKVRDRRHCLAMPMATRLNSKLSLMG